MSEHSKKSNLYRVELRTFNKLKAIDWELDYTNVINKLYDLKIKKKFNDSF